jgi:hypothetical protein
VKILSIPKMLALGRNCLDIACREIAALHVCLPVALLPHFLC